jgi:hypothetical protein
MNAPFRRDQNQGPGHKTMNMPDELMNQMRSMNTMAEAARKAGYEDGYRAGLLEAKRLFEEAFNTWPGQK